MKDLTDTATALRSRWTALWPPRGKAAAAWGCALIEVGVHRGRRLRALAGQRSSSAAIPSPLGPSQRHHPRATTTADAGEDDAETTETMRNALASLAGCDLASPDSGGLVYLGVEPNPDFAKELDDLAATVRRHGGTAVGADVLTSTAVVGFDAHKVR